MWYILGIIIVAIGAILYEVPSLLKRKLHKEIWIFSILLVFGVSLSIAERLDVELPNPFDWLTDFFKPLTDFILGLLE